MPANKYFVPSAGGMQDLDLPSGGKVQVRMLEVEDLIELEIMDKMDELGGIVQTDHIDRVKGTNKPSDRPKKKPTKAEQVALDEKRDKEETQRFLDLVKDKKRFTPLQHVIDKVIAFAVVQPVINLAFEDAMAESPDGPVKTAVKIPMKDRDPLSLYTDNMKFEDKMHIFGVVLPGAESMKTFRSESTESVGDVADESDDAGSTE